MSSGASLSLLLDQPKLLPESDFIGIPPLSLDQSLRKQARITVRAVDLGGTASV